MPQGISVVVSHHILSNAEQGLSYFCLRACSPFSKHFTRMNRLLWLPLRAAFIPSCDLLVVVRDIQRFFATLR